MATKRITATPQRTDFDFDDFLAAGYRVRQAPPVQEQAPPEPEKPSVARRIGDVGLSLGQGALGSFKSISDFFGADNPVSGGLDDASKFLGAQKSAQSQAATQASMARIKEAEASGSTLDEAQAYLGMLWDQPAEMIAQGVGSFATLGVGKVAQALKLAQAAKAAGVSKDVFLASGAAKQAVEEAAKFGFKTNIGLGAVQGVGAVKGSQFEQTYENARQQGMPEEEARALAAQAQEYGGAGTMQQVLGGVLGGVASATGPIERTLLGAGKKPVQSGVMSSVAKGFGKEFATEGGQGAQERFAGNDAAVDAGVLAPERRMQGVVGQGLMEGTIGGLLGGITGPLEGQAAALDPAVNPAKEAADTIRATEKLPESGALTKAMNAGVEAKAQAVEAGGLQLAPLVVEQTATAPNDLALEPLPGESAPEPVDDPVRDQILALPDGARQDALRAYAVLNRPDAAKGVLQLNRKLLDRLLEENKPEPEATPEIGDVVRTFDPASPPVSELSLAPMGEVAYDNGIDFQPDSQAELSSRSAELDKLTQRAPRTRTDGVGLNLQTDPVQNYLDNLRSVNTPAARAYVRDFDAGRITPDDVQQRMQAEQGLTPEQRIARAAAEAPAQVDTVAERLRSAAAQGMATPAPTDILNPAGEPFKTKMAADLAAKKTPGAAVLPVVDGGFLVRPQEPVNVQDVPQAPEVPQAAPVVSQPSQAQEAVGAQPAGPAAGVPTEGAGAVEAAGVADGPGSDAGNGFKRGPQEGERYRVGVSSATGGVTIEKRLPAGTVATFYVGKDGGLIDADDVNLVGTKDREKLWIPTTPEQASQATAILDEMGRLDLTDPKRKDAKARLKALVTATAAVEAAGVGGANSGVAAPAPQTGPIRLGRNNTPLSEGGKPFKTRKAAGDAKKLQPTMRVVTVPGGYALAEKTPAQLAAEERASRRLRNPNTSARGEPIPAHAFIAAAGGLNRAAASDMGVDGNPRIGNRTLFAGQGRGLSMDQATQMLIQDGYLSEGATINDALALIKKSLTQPQYNADGIERIAQAEADAQFEDYLAAQEDAAADDDEFDPFGPAPTALDEFSDDMLESSGYDAATDAIKAEVRALLEMANAQGIDTESIMLEAHEQTRNATEQDYYEAAKSALEAAIAGSNRDRSTPAGSESQGQGQERDAANQELNQPETLTGQSQAATESVAPGTLELAAQTPAEAAALQDAQEQAAKAEAAAKRAADAAAAKEEDRKRIAQASVRAADRFELGQDPLDSLTGQGSMFDDAPEQPRQAPEATKSTAQPITRADVAAAQQQTAPKLTPAEAKSLMAWEDLGQKDGVKTHALTFYESQADKDAKRGRMIVAKVSKGDRSATAWMVDGEDKTFGALAQAKKLAEEVGMAKAVADGFVEPAAAKPAAAKPAAAPQPEAPAAPITDFGEKIGGARKDVWSGFKDDLNKVLDDDIAGQPLAKVWPAPDYQKLIDAGMNAKTVAAVRALRDEVPAKPRAAWKVKRWAEQVKTLRGLANDVMDGKITVQDMERMGANKGTSLRGMMGRIELYELVGHEKSLEGVRFAHHHYTIYKGRENVSLWVVEKDAGASAFSNWPREIAIGDTKEQALAAFKEKYAGLDLEKAVRKASFDIFSERGSNAFYVGKKIGRNYAKLEGPFNTVREAREYREKNLQALEAKLEKYKEIPRERADVNQPRVGVDMRNGQDVTPQMFGEVFGFRGVEFGNWVEQKRRQKDLNDAFDALMDMAAVLDIPPKAISLNGQLGLAFGARGSGGVNPAAAHYEPDNVVINLTKKEGAGSLGHEWWHALDNYFAKQRKVNRGSFMTTGTDVGLAARGKDYYYEGGIRQEMIDAFGAVVKAINQTAMKARASTLDGKRTKDYWTTGEEMSARAFESYLISKLQDQNASNDYLANVVSEKTWDAMAALGMENENSYPYPTAAEIPAIRAGFDHFFQTVETKETDKGVALFATASTPVAPGQGVTLQAAQQATDKVLDGLGMRGVVVPKVVHNPAAAGIPTPSGIVPTGGTSNGEVYLFTDNLHDDADVFKVVFHELFHLGLSQSVKPADYIKTMLQFMNDPLVRQHANAWKQSADGQSRIRSMPRNNWHALAVEEALADIAEEVNANNKGIGTKEMQGWVRRTIAWLADLAQSWKMPAVARKLRGMTYTQAEAFVQETMLKGRTGAPVLLPDTRFRTTAQSIASSMGDMTPDQEKAYKNVAGVKAAPTVRERMDALKSNLGLKLRQGLVDQFAAIKQLDQNAYVQARMSKGTDGTLEAILMYGKPFMRDGAPDVDVKDGGFAKVLASLKGEQDRWMMWIAAQRAEKLKAEGKENLMTDDDISALKTLNAGKMADGTARMPVYAKALAELNEYNDAMLKLAMDSGLIDKDAYDLMAGQPYVPFYRLMEEGDMKGPKFSSGLVNQKAWQKLKGGTQQLNADLLQNMLLNWSHLLQASAKNRAATATMDAAEKMAVAYKVSADTKGAVKVMRDGSAEHWMVEDPYLLDAISAIHYVPSPLMKPLAKFKQLLTWGVTVNPTFKIRNLIRDSVSAIAQSELGYNPGANVAKGWKLTAKDSQIYASMLASGGLIKFGTQENTDRLRAQVAKLGGVVLDKSGTERFFGQIKDLYDVYNEFGDRAENVNRAALYDALIKKGKTHAEAAFMARDLMDFSMSGSAPVVRFLTQAVPFLNARLVGLDKLGRAAMEDPRRFVAVTGAVALASLALLAAYSDDDDWKKREDWDRDAYWWFKVGDQAYRIPKPFEVGAIGTLAERTAELMLSDEMTGKRYMERVSHMLSGTFSFNPVPQAFKPLLDLYANKDSFTGRAIESQADQRLRPQDRYSERTPEVAKFLGGLGLPDPAQLVKGEYSALSPKQVEHLIRGYFSWVGTAAMTVSDFGLRPLAGRGERPDMRLKDVFIAGNFVENLPTGSSRYVTQMYEQSRQAEQAYASYQEAIKAGDTEKAQSIKESAGPLLRNRPAYTAATRQLAEINRTAKRIEADQAMAGAAKRARLTQLEQQRHVIAQRVSRLAAATP